MNGKKEAWLLLIGMGLSFPAVAAPSFYGSVEGGMTRAHNDLPWVANEDTLSVQNTNYGDGETFGLNLGMKLDSPLLVELGYNQTTVENDDSIGAIVSGGGSCDVAPLLGLIDDCWDRGEISIEVERKNIELIAGWTLKSGAFDITPYAGLRQQELTDSRKVNYLYDGGVSNFITQDIEVEGLGIVLGARVEQAIGQFFWGGDAQYAHMDVDRDMIIDDKEINTPGGTLSQEMMLLASDSTTSLQYGLKVYGGMKFDLAGQEAKVSLGYAYQENTNVLVTSNTSPVTYTPATLGNSSADLRTDTVFLTFGVALK